MYLPGRYLLRQGGRVARYGQADDVCPFFYRNEVGVRVAGAETAHFKGLLAALFQGKLEGKYGVVKYWQGLWKNLVRLAPGIDDRHSLRG